MDAAVTIGGIFFGALLTWSGTYFFHYFQIRSLNRRRLNVFFGELLSIQMHYEFAAAELPRSIESVSDLLALKMSTYGQLSYSGKEVSTLDLLTDVEIARMMQLALKIRNTDFAIEMVAASKKHGADFPNFTQEDHRMITDRMVYVSAVVNGLVSSLSNRYPNFKLLILKSESTV